MATTALVDRDLDIGRKILGVLGRAGIGVSVAFWAHVPQISEWQLFIATPLVDTKGPKSAYEHVLRVLKEAGMESELPWRRIFLRSPKDSVLKSLENWMSDGGSIEIVESENIPRGTPSAYYVTYAPQTGATFRVLNLPVGDRLVEEAYMYGATWLVTGIIDLRALLSKLHINRDDQESAIKELSERRRSLIPDVRLRVRDFKRLRPA
jgi:hypothetical protein